MPTSPRIILTEHVRDRMLRRGISADDIAAVIAQPSIDRPGSGILSRRYEKHVSGRNLAVVVEPQGQVVVVITAFWMGER